MSQSSKLNKVSPQLVNLVGLVSLSIADQIRQATELAAGQSASAPAALVLIHRYPEITVDVLGRYLQLSQSGAVRLVDRLAQQGWIERNRGQDKRFVTLSLTEVGAGVAIAILQERQQQIAQALTVLTLEEQQQLSHLLLKLTSQHDHIGEQAEFMCRLCDMSVCPLAICQDRWSGLNNAKP
ncbi:MAG: MarR family winged helix-turn-helix transcriptional regulator [Thermosynechococcaceae cyanobacterium]